MSKGTVLPVLN